jgi:RNA polymerase sigma-70 factor (ECF subfamily)
LEHTLTLQPTQETGLSHSLRPAATADGDWESVEACRKGSLAAFDKLYQRHGGRMKSIACNLMGNPTDAEDAVQEAFLKIYRNVKTFRGKSSFSTWVYRILINTCIDMKRKRHLHDVVQPSPVAGIAQPALPASNHPLRLTLEKLVGRLDARLRHVFLLFEVEGFKHSEIAEILEISEASSKHALFEAKRELRDRLKRSRIVRTSDEA